MGNNEQEAVEQKDIISSTLFKPVVSVTLFVFIALWLVWQMLSTTSAPYLSIDTEVENSVPVGKEEEAFAKLGVNLSNNPGRRPILACMTVLKRAEGRGLPSIRTILDGNTRNVEMGDTRLFSYVLSLLLNPEIRQEAGHPPREMPRLSRTDYMDYRGLPFLITEIFGGQQTTIPEVMERFAHEYSHMLLFDGRLNNFMVGWASLRFPKPTSTYLHDIYNVEGRTISQGGVWVCRHDLNPEMTPSLFISMVDTQVLENSMNVERFAYRLSSYLLDPRRKGVELPWIKLSRSDMDDKSFDLLVADLQNGVVRSVEGWVDHLVLNGVQAEALPPDLPQ